MTVLEFSAIFFGSIDYLVCGIFAAEGALGRGCDRYTAIGTSIIWPLFAFIGVWDYLHEYIDDVEHRRKLRQKRRRAELDAEYRKAIEELEDDQ